MLYILAFAAGVCFTLLSQKALSIYTERVLKREREKAAQERAKADRRNELSRARYSENPQVPLRSQARSVVRSVVLLEKKFRQDYDSTISTVIANLAATFDEVMSFENYGAVWEVDHVIPLKSFDLTDPAQFKSAIHPTNLRALFRGENQSKGCK